MGHFRFCWLSVMKNSKLKVLTSKLSTVSNNLSTGLPMIPGGHIWGKACNPCHCSSVVCGIRCRWPPCSFSSCPRNPGEWLWPLPGLCRDRFWSTRPVKMDPWISHICGQKSNVQCGVMFNFNTSWHIVYQISGDYRRLEFVSGLYYLHPAVSFWLVLLVWYCIFSGDGFPSDLKYLVNLMWSHDICWFSDNKLVTVSWRTPCQNWPALIELWNTDRCKESTWCVLQYGLRRIRPLKWDTASGCYTVRPSHLPMHCLWPQAKTNTLVLAGMCSSFVSKQPPAQSL